MRAAAMLLLVHGGCGSSSVTVDRFGVGECPQEWTLRLATYGSDVGCERLDPSGPTGDARLVPLDQAEWTDRAREDPPRLRAPDGRAVIEAYCIDPSAVSRLWGCTREDGGEPAIDLGTICSPGPCDGCDWSCPPGAVARWSGGELCVQGGTTGSCAGDGDGDADADADADSDADADADADADGDADPECLGCTGQCCDGACVDTYEDEENCGGCGVACRNGTCAASFCLCPAQAPDQCGSYETDLVCTDLLSDPENCGTCGLACGNGSCCNGACEC